MKQIIRHGVFETNSSSTHSLSIQSGNVRPFNLPLDDDGYIIAEFGEFGWGYEELITQEQKFSYLLTYVVASEMNNYYKSAKKKADQLLRETVGYKLLLEFAEEYCEGISLDLCSLELVESYKDGQYIVESYGYVDHQSVNGNLANWLRERKVTIEEVVLNDGVKIIIDNDNRY